MIKLDVLTKRIVFVLFAFILLFFIWLHFRLSLTRYIDVDEFAHLSWTSHWLGGYKPYIDFLTFFPPGFMVFLAPAFLFGTSVEPFLAARFFIFLVYLGILGCLGYVFYLTRRSWLWILAVVAFVFLPLPKDKFLEIRPDSVATLFGILAIIFQIRWMRNWKNWDSFLTGLLCSISLLILPKMVPQVGVAVLIAGAAWLVKVRYGKNLMGKFDSLKPLIIGLGVPFILFGIWTLTLGNLSIVIYSLTKLPVEANKISEVFIMLPNLFFYPNGIFYGENGYPLSLKINHGIWVASLLFGAYRLLTPFLTRGKQYVYEELLLSTTFYVHVLFYTLLVPLKHTQYLIPIAIFVAYYFADALYVLWEKSRKSVVGLVVFLFFMILASVLMFEAYYQTNKVKLTWTNTQALSFMKTMYQTIPKNEYVLDLDGRTLYYPYPYYACCIPFGQSSPYLTRPLPSLSDALERTQTKYIYQGELKRVDTLRLEDQVYINSHYHSWNGDAQLLMRN